LKMPSTTSHGCPFPMVGLVRVLVLLAVYLSFPGTTWAAPYLSSLLPSSSSGETESVAVKGKVVEENEQGLLVSRIVNRELEASIVAHSWPSTPHSVICEAWAMVQDYAFLDQWVAHELREGEQSQFSYQDLTERAVKMAAASTSTVYPPLMQYALVLRASSPICELHRGLARETLYQFRLLEDDDDDDESMTCGNKGGGTTNRNAFALVYRSGRLALTVEDLKRNVEEAESEMDSSFSFQSFQDVLLPEEEPRTTKRQQQQHNLVILYANMASFEFGTFYQALVQLDVPFVVRHLGDVTQHGSSTSSSDNNSVCSSSTDDNSDSSSPTILQGYGVRLDIRNVEYKVFDDRKQQGEEEASQNNINVTALEHLTPQFLAGINVTALREEAGKKGSESGGGDEDWLHLQHDLWKLHVAQELHSQMVPPAWQRRQLSLQAVSSIVTGATTSTTAVSDPLVTLQDLSQNLPSVASTLVHVEVDLGVESIAEQLEQVLQSMIQASGGGLWVNGRPVGIERPSFNVFELIKLFQTEQEQLDRLETALKPYFVSSTSSSDGTGSDGSQVALKAIQQAWAMGDNFFDTGAAGGGGGDGGDGEDDMDDEDGLGPSSSSKQYRIDVGRGWQQAVMYVNDVEKDVQYRDWPTSMEQMIMAMQYGMPPRVRRNVFTILAVTDLSTRDDALNPGKKLAAQLLQSQFPVRVGLLIVSEKDIAACAEWVETTQPADGVACPMTEPDPLLDMPRDTPSVVPTTEQLKDMPATARVVHRLLSYMLSEFSHMPHMMGPYQDYLSQYASSGFQRKSANDDRLSVVELLNFHTQLLQQLQVGGANNVADVVRGMLDMEEESRDNTDDEDPKNLIYGKAVRFAVDKGLKPGMSFLNGIPMPAGSDENSMDLLSSLFMGEQNRIFQMIMKHEITDSSPRSIYDKLLSGDRVFPRVHPLLSDTSSEHRYMYISHPFGPNSLLYAATSKDGESPIPPGIDDADAVFVVDAFLAIDTRTGLEIASKLVTLMSTFPSTIGKDSVAIGYRIIPSSESAAKSMLCPILADIGSVGAGIIHEILAAAAKGEDVTELAKSHGLSTVASEDGPCSKASYLEEGLLFQNFLVANGRAFPLQTSSLEKVDLDLLLSIDLARSKAVWKLLQNSAESTNVSFDGISRTTAYLSVAATDAKLKRSNPEEDINAIERQLLIQNKNPLRFSWNSGRDDDSKALKVRMCTRVVSVGKVAFFVLNPCSVLVLLFAIM
jgi:hypothetical protein